MKTLLLRIRSEKEPLKFIFSRLLWSTGISRLFIIKCQEYLLRYYPTALSSALWLNPEARKNEEDFIKDYIRANDTIIDIGANIGSLTILSAIKAGDEGRVFAFEPHPKIYQFLNKNIRLNKLKNIATYNVALGSRSGKIHFSSQKSDDMNSVVNPGNQSAITMNIHKLDDVLPYSSLPIALLKLDVEGYEKFVLEGSSEILKRTACIYFESSQNHFERYGYHSHDLFKYIKEAGFNIYQIIAKKTLCLINSDHISVDGEDLFAIKDEQDFIDRTGYRIIHEV